MSNKKRQTDEKITRIKSPSELGDTIRSYRQAHGFTLEKVSSLTHVGMRFLSELERGKETAELGKVLQVINRLGLEIVIQPRNYQHTVTQEKDDE